MANITATPNQGYKFTRWSVTSGTTPTNFNSNEQNQSVNILGDTTIELYLEAIPLPRDGGGNILFPIISSDGNRGQEIDRNMLAMTKDAGAVALSSLYVPSFDRVRAVVEKSSYQLPDSSIASSIDPTPAIRIFSRDNSGNQVETLLTLLDSLSGYRYGEGAEGISNFKFGSFSYSIGRSIESILLKGRKGRLAVSPNGLKIMYGNPGDYFESTINTGGTRGVTQTPYGAIEYGTLNVGSVSNINADDDIGILSGTDVNHVNGASTIDYDFSRHTSKTWYGHSICVTKNYAAYSAPSSVSGDIPIQRSQVDVNLSNNSVPAYDSTQATPNDSNVVHIVPNSYLNNTGISAAASLFTGYEQEKDENDYIVFDLGSRDIGGSSSDGSYSQFGRSVDVSRDSPTLAESSQTNPIYVAITSAWKPSNSDLVYTSWNRSKSITKIIGVYEESGTIYKIGMGLREPSDTSSVKNPATTQDLLGYRAAWNSISLYVDDRTDLGDDIITLRDKNGNKKRLETVGEKWSAFQTLNFQINSQPYYVLISPELDILNTPIQYTDTETYKNWLNDGLKSFTSQNKLP